MFGGEDLSDEELEFLIQLNLIHNGTDTNT